MPPGSIRSRSPGNWGGLVFRRDVDQAEGRRDLEDEGIFLQHVNHADIRYGGTGNLLIDSVQQIVNPIQIVNLRPTITFNEISFSADAAISAFPNSFRETSFQSPEFQINDRVHRGLHADRTRYPQQPVGGQQPQWSVRSVDDDTRQPRQARDDLRAVRRCQHCPRDRRRTWS